MAVIQGGQVIDIESALQRIFHKAGVPASGDFNGQAEKGQLCVDSTNGKLHINTGTKSATVWTVVGAQT
jgi:hypothetical protein